MDTNSEPKIQLTTLLNAAGYRLAYTLPLLLFSIVITLAGTFLTLDRTRVFPTKDERSESFPGAYDEIFNRGRGAKKKKKAIKRDAMCWSRWTYRLDGGIGGLLVGYIFGLHTATFLSLYIPNTGSSSPLSPAAFLVVWMFTVIPSTLLGGRWRFAALLLIGVAGGFCLSLGLLIIMHPNLHTRVVFTSVLVPLTTIITLIPNLPFFRLRYIVHSVTRISTSALGAFSVTFAVANLARNNGSPSWANAYDRLWVANGNGWGKPSEHGFSTVFCVLWAFGAACDWALRRKLGDSVDEIWESYLAEYSNGLPNERNRAGYYRPHETWWHKLLTFLHIRKHDSSSARPQDIIFPTDAELGFPKPYGVDTDPKYTPLSMIEHQQKDSTFEITPFMSPPRATVGFFDMVKGLPKAYTGKDDVAHGAVDGTTVMEALNLPRRKKTLHRPGDTRIPLTNTHNHDESLSKRKQRTRLQFRPHSTYSESESDSDTELDALKTPPLTSPQRPKLKVTNFACASGTSLSGTTVRNDSSSGAQVPSPGEPSSGTASSEQPSTEQAQIQIHDLRDAFGLGMPPRIHDRDPKSVDYSDVEVGEADVTSALRQIRAPSAHPTIRRERSKRRNDRVQDDTGLVPPARPHGAVPMTPSLVNALRRIAVAQQEAFGPRVTSPVGSPREQITGLPITATLPRVASPTSSPPTRAFSPIINETFGPLGAHTHELLPQVEIDMNDENGAAKWDEFWQEVSDRAAEVHGPNAQMRMGARTRADEELGGQVGSPAR